MADEDIVDLLLEFDKLISDRTELKRLARDAKAAGSAMPPSRLLDGSAFRQLEFGAQLELRAQQIHGRIANLPPGVGVPQDLLLQILLKLRRMKAVEGGGDAGRFPTR